MRKKKYKTSMQRLRLPAHEQALLLNLVLVLRFFQEVARWRALLKRQRKGKAKMRLQRI
jgi:hypothetical protein